MLKLASWNVNSLKIRLEQVLNWFEACTIDILALQEIKTTDEDFPLAAFSERGYQVVYAGQKSYNGVAIISRYAMANPLTDLIDFPDPQRRLLAVTIGDIRLINLYVPNGANLTSDKYQYKLTWLAKMTVFIQQQLQLYPKLAVVGDFNIAPADIDVHDPIAWQGSVLVSAAERQAFNQLLTLGLTDSFRYFPREGQHFSWWDYRAGGFRRNHGLRIDHILLSQELTHSCLRSEIDRKPRQSERPSDHAPIWVELSLTV